MADFEPGTPGTPTTPTPLMSSLRVDSLSYDRKSMPRCKCLPLDSSTWAAPQTCLTHFSAPEISLTRKVSLSLSLSHARALSYWDLRSLHARTIFLEILALTNSWKIYSLLCMENRKRKVEIQSGFYLKLLLHLDCSITITIIVQWSKDPRYITIIIHMVGLIFRARLVKFISGSNSILYLRFQYLWLLPIYYPSHL